MSIVVTGATGNLGGLTVDALLERGVEPSGIVAAGRNPDRLAELAAKGVGTAKFDVDDPGTLAATLKGAEMVLLVSLRGNPRRVEQHRSAIEAAKAAGVQRIIYTSFLHADRNADHTDHKATEQMLTESGTAHTVMRNGAYFTFLTRQIPGWREEREITGAAGAGRISAASLADLAAANATVLTTAGHDGCIYELGIDDAFTMEEFAAELSRQTGEEVPYVDLAADELKSRLVRAGQPEAIASRRVVSDVGIAGGLFFTDSGDLARLVGRPLTGLSGAVAQAIR